MVSCRGVVEQPHGMLECSFVSWLLYKQLILFPLIHQQWKRNTVIAGIVLLAANAAVAYVSSDKEVSYIVGLYMTVFNARVWEN